MAPLQEEDDHLFHCRWHTKGAAVCQSSCCRGWRGHELVADHRSSDASQGEEPCHWHRSLLGRLWKELRTDNKPLAFHWSVSFRFQARARWDHGWPRSPYQRARQGFPDDQVEKRKLELLFHATNLFVIHEHIVDTPGLTYEECIKKAKQHERTVTDFRDHAASWGVRGSAIPPYSDPLLSAHAVQRCRRPTGRGQGQQRGDCTKCGRSHERGNCPAYGIKCHKCSGPNHFKQVCCSRNAFSSSKQGGQSPYQKKGKQRDRRPSGNSKGKGKGRGGGTPGKKKPFYKDKKKAYAVTLKQDSVPSAPQEGEAGRYESNKCKVKSENSVLLGPPKAGTFNSFACDAVHSKLSHTHNESNAPSKRLYTDTDPSSQTEIITDIQVKKPARAGSLWMEVKVDPGSEANCMPLHKFRVLFPYLCRDGLPKEGVLEPTTAKFTGYSGTDMKSLGHVELQTQNIATKKYHKLKFHVLDIESPRILVCHAAAYWIGLIEVLCANKAPKRQVDSLTCNASQSQSHSRWLKDGPLRSTSLDTEDQTKGATSKKGPQDRSSMGSYSQDGKAQMKGSGRNGKWVTSTVTEDQHRMTASTSATETREVSQPPHTPGKNSVLSEPTRTLQSKQLNNPLRRKSNCNTTQLA